MAWFRKIESLTRFCCGFFEIFGFEKWIQENGGWGVSEFQDSFIFELF